MVPWVNMLISRECELLLDVDVGAECWRYRLHLDPLYLRLKCFALSDR
jgi:hypothetical protein